MSFFFPLRGLAAFFFFACPSRYPRSRIFPFFPSLRDSGVNSSFPFPSASFVPLCPFPGPPLHFFWTQELPSSLFGDYAPPYFISPDTILGMGFFSVLQKLGGVFSSLPLYKLPVFPPFFSQIRETKGHLFFPPPLSPFFFCLRRGRFASPGPTGSPPLPPLWLAPTKEDQPFFFWNSLHADSPFLPYFGTAFPLVVRVFFFSAFPSYSLSSPLFPFFHDEPPSFPMFEGSEVAARPFLCPFFHRWSGGTSDVIAVFFSFVPSALKKHRINLTFSFLLLPFFFRLLQLCGISPFLLLFFSF